MSFTYKVTDTQPNFIVSKNLPYLDTLQIT